MSLVLPLFGIILNTRMFKYQVDSLMAVTEKFLNDRWIILYRLSQGQYVVFARYMLFDSWNNLEHITKRVRRRCRYLAGKSSTIFGSGAN